MFGDIVHSRLEFLPAILDRDRQSYLAQKRKIGEIISDKSNFTILAPSFGFEFGISLKLVADALINHPNSEVARAVTDRFREASRDQRNGNPVILKKFNSLAIADIEAFNLLPPVIDRDAAIREHAIDVEDQQLNRARLAPESRR